MTDAPETSAVKTETPPKRRRYTLAELLAQCNPDAPMTPEDREWVDAPAVGRELI